MPESLYHSAKSGGEDTHVNLSEITCGGNNPEWFTTTPEKQSIRLAGTRLTSACAVSGEWSAIDSVGRGFFLNQRRTLVVDQDGNSQLPLLDLGNCTILACTVVCEDRICTRIVSLRARLVLR